MSAPGADPERGMYAVVIFALAVGMVVMTAWLAWTGLEWCWTEFVGDWEG